MLTIKEAFDGMFEGVKFDSNFFKRLKKYKLEYISKNTEHQEFFGSNLLGVHRVRFTMQDYEEFMVDVIKKSINELESTVDSITTINKEFKVSADPLNQLLVYMVHRFMTTPLMNETQRKEAAICVAEIFNYRTIAILITTYFKYPIDVYMAQAVYEKLSGRYLIKKYGTWQKVFHYRAEEFISKDGVSYQTLVKYNDDMAIVNVINDIRNRTKDMVKNIYAEFIKVHESGGKLGNRSSTMIDADGDEIVKDHTHGLEIYQGYLHDVLHDRNSFIKVELLDVVERVIPTARAKYIQTVLEWMADQAYGENHKLIIEYVDLVLTISFNYLLKNEHLLHRNKDIIKLTGLLKGFILSSREDSDELKQLRDIGSDIVTRVNGKQSIHLVSATRNALFIYICLRAYTKHAYSH